MTKMTAKKMNLQLTVVAIVFAVIAVGLFVLGWTYILGLGREQGRLQTEADNYILQNQALFDLKLQLARLGSQKDVVYQIIPSSKDVSDFVKTFEQMAIGDRVTINTVTIGDVQKKSKSGSDLSQTVAKDQYSELPIRYEVTGNYLDITKLVDDVMQGRRLAKITNLSVITNTSDGAASGSVKATFNVTVFIKK